jgi:hypothetical protein
MIHRQVLILVVAFLFGMFVYYYPYKWWIAPENEFFVIVTVNERPLPVPALTAEGGYLDLTDPASSRLESNPEFRR